MSIAAELEREAKGRRGVLADPGRWIYCQAQGPRREPCWRRPTVPKDPKEESRWCDECWREAVRRVK